MQSMLFLTALLLLSAPLHNTSRVLDPGDSIEGDEGVPSAFDDEDDDDEGVPSAFDDEFGEESLDSRPVLTRALGTRSLEPLSVDDDGDEDPGDSIVWDSPFYERPPARLANVGKAGSQRPSLQRMGGQRHLDQVAILCDADGVKEFLHQRYAAYKKVNEKVQTHFDVSDFRNWGAAVDDVTVSDDRKHATATLTWTMEFCSHAVRHSVPFTLVCEKDTWTPEKRQAAFGEPVKKPEDPGDSIEGDEGVPGAFDDEDPGASIEGDEGVPGAFDDEDSPGDSIDDDDLSFGDDDLSFGEVAILCDADGVKEFLHQHYAAYKKENEKAQATLHFRGEDEPDGGAAVEDVTVSEDRKHATATLTWTMENDFSHAVQHSVPFTLVCEKDTWTQEKRQAARGVRRQAARERGAQE